MYRVEDVIGGGKNYFKVVGKKIGGVEWWGDVCIGGDVEKMGRIELKEGKERIVVRVKEVNEGIEKGEKGYEVWDEVKGVGRVMWG